MSISRAQVLSTGAVPYILRKDHGYQPPGMHCYVRRLRRGHIRTYFIYVNYMEFEHRQMLFRYGLKLPEELQPLLLDKRAPEELLQWNKDRLWYGKPGGPANDYISHDYSARCMYLEGIEDPSTFESGPGRWGNFESRPF